MRNAHASVRLFALAIFSIAALASCAGRNDPDPGAVTPSRENAKILKALEKCTYGALIADNRTNDDIELRTYRKHKIGILSSHSSNQVFCFSENDLNEPGVLDIAFGRSASGMRMGRLETINAISIPLQSTRVWKIWIGPNTSSVGWVPVFSIR